MEESLQLTTKIALDAWNTHISRTDKLLNGLTDEALQNKVSPERNTGTYLLGHLTAVHDALFPLLGLGEKLYPELEDLFIRNPDRPEMQRPSAKDLRSYWQKVNTDLSKHFSELSTDEWLQKHTSVSEEDFKNEPHRNRLNVLTSRTNHLAYHLGQLAFLKK